MIYIVEIWENLPIPPTAMDQNESKEIKVNFKPLENIALGFSGGGYRAASFTLGILSYFDHLKYKGNPLLKNVVGLSTVSGGTISGALYAAYSANGMPFQEFYKKLYDFMREDKLMGEALKKLEDDEVWKNIDKNRSLINAFALCYKEMLTDASMGDLKKSDSSHLEDVIFNATEFSGGLPFRFLATKSGGKFGNGNLNCSELNAVTDKVLVSDAIAASSCFPMGFEPMVFPEDFIQKGSSEFEALKKTYQFRDSVGLMDGGIVDNQGIGSVLKAESRRSNKNSDLNQFGLLMVCDVSSPFMNNWVGDKEKKAEGWRSKTFNTIQTLIPSSPLLRYSGLIVTLVGVAALITAKLWPNMGVCNYADMHLISGLLISLGLIMLAVKYIGKLGMMLLKTFALLKINEALPEFIRGRLRYFGNLHLSMLEVMLKNRITSVIKMVSEVFMKQVRRLTYFQVYSNDDWWFRRSTCLIYDLTAKGIEWRRKVAGHLSKYHTDSMNSPGEKIKRTAEIAYNMGTTLWFEEEDRRQRTLECLVATGQFTVCFSLMLYLNELNQDTKGENDPVSPYKGCLTNDTDLAATYKQLEADWEKFKKDPFWLMSAIG